MRQFPGRPALELRGERLTYAELGQTAKSLAATLRRWVPAGEGPLLTAVFAARSATAFAGVLAALLRGHGYVPLSRTFPPERTAAMLRRSGCRALVVDSESASQLDAILAGAADGMLLVLPDQTDVSAAAARWPRHRVLGAGDLEPEQAWEPPEPPGRDAIAYLLFTSGSTGEPKGVMVAHRNVEAFLDATQAQHDFRETDRFSQTFDLTFDLSAFDMFMAWRVGACLCCPDQRTLLQPGRFIRESGLTVWFSVPSTGILMKRLGALKPGLYPSLRWSLFCGEPLPVEVAEAWAGAAPNSTVENLYGPTEVTIACTSHRWDGARTPDEAPQGIVPIGRPLPGMRALVADEEGREVPPGHEGELLMAGPQVTLGYLDDAAKTAQAFAVPPGQSEVHYRTGDRVVRPAGDGPLCYVGRMDHQVKIFGHRVELGEVEAAVREASNCAGVVAVGWPVTPSGVGGIAVFIESDAVDAEAVRARVSARLPDYMVPRQIRAVGALPVNSNGKYDRRALLRGLEEAPCPA